MHILTGNATLVFSQHRVCDTSSSFILGKQQQNVGKKLLQWLLRRMADNEVSAHYLLNHPSLPVICRRQSLNVLQQHPVVLCSLWYSTHDEQICDGCSGWATKSHNNPFSITFTTRVQQFESITCVRSSTHSFTLSPSFIKESDIYVKPQKSCSQKNPCRRERAPDSSLIQILCGAAGG